MVAGVIEGLIVTLKLPTPFSPNATDWDQIFGTLPSLRKLEIRQQSNLFNLSNGTFFESSPGSTLRDLWLPALVWQATAGGRGIGGEIGEMLC